MVGISYTLTFLLHIFLLEIRTKHICDCMTTLPTRVRMICIEINYNNVLSVPQFFIFQVGTNEYHVVGCVKVGALDSEIQNPNYAC